MSSSQPSEKKRKRHSEKEDRPRKKKHRASTNEEGSQPQAQPPTVAITSTSDSERPPNSIKLILVPRDVDTIPIIGRPRPSSLLDRKLINLTSNDPRHHPPHLPHLHSLPQV